MSHCDEETLSLLALGEPGPAAVEDHLAQCDHCRAELSALREVVVTARWDVTDVPRIVPPSRVWDQIAAATGVQATPNADVVVAHAAIPPRREPAAPAPDPVQPESSGSALPLPRQRSRSWTSRLDGRLLAVAATCLAVGLLGGVFGTRWLSAPGPTGAPGPAAPVVAATKLSGLPAAPTASGQADVTESGGRRTLDLDVRSLGAPEGFYEVWLIDPTVTKMVPVGVLSGTEGRFTLPAGVNLADYPLVDVSIEPLDGNPAHSGTSVLRGTLRS